MIYEWTVLAEKMGVNLFSVIDGIKVRDTHSNMMKPGFGVGGYCLTKDSLLAHWSADNFYESDFGLPFSKMALDVNDKMPLHTVEIILSQTQFQDKKVAVLGVSYRQDVGDTRYSPAETFCREIRKYGAECIVHDPYVSQWPEMPNVAFIDSLKSLTDADVIVLAVRHKDYLELEASQFVRNSKRGALFVDANDILNDDKIRYLLANDRNVIGVGKGHIESIRKEIICAKY